MSRATASRFGWIRPALLVLGALLLLDGLLYLVWRPWYSAHAEYGPLETVQFLLWCLVVLTGLGAFLRHAGQDRANALLLTVVSLLAMARETDLHEYLNEDTLGPYAVSFRLSWWLDMGEPLLPKVLWAALGLALAAALIVPLLKIKAPLLPLLRSGDAGTWLFCIGIGLYGAGYLMDDVLGRGLLWPEEPGQAVEEAFESLGVIAILASMIVALRVPLTRRVERALGRAA